MKRVALFVGVDEYEDGSIADLEHAVDDSESLAAAFETLLGFDRVEKLRNPPGKKDILGKVRELTDGLEKGDLFFFYFAGHGFRVKENHVLVCREDSYGDLEDEYDGLPMGQLKKRARGPWNRMLVIDACQNDIRKTRGADEGMKARDLALILEDGEDGGFAGEGVQVVVTSCSEGQKALEVGDLGHGLFTSALLETVKDHARTRRRLDLDGFRAEMGKRMGELARKYRLSGKQNPMFRVPGECGIVLLEGEPDADSGGSSRWSGPSMPTTTVPTGHCEKCGAHPFLTDMFDCPRCGKTLCKEHRGEGTYWCEDCVADEKMRKEKAEAEKKKAAQEAARKAREAAEAERRAKEAENARKKKEEERRRKEEEKRKREEEVATQRARLLQKQHQERWRTGETRTIDLPGGETMEMVWCPPGEFQMGSPAEEKGRKNDESLHDVILTNGFWIGKYPVTQAQWQSVMKELPSTLDSLGPNIPVSHITWEDCMEFCKKLEEETGEMLRMPTEAQWEYACRAGNTGGYGENGRLTEMGWFKDNSGGQVHPVGQKAPNAWGLHDMLGNVGEFCGDGYGQYPSEIVLDPKGSAKSEKKVVRGGSFDSPPQECRPASRNSMGGGWMSNRVGFRLCRPDKREDRPEEVRGRQARAVLEQQNAADVERRFAVEKARLARQEEERQREGKCRTLVLPGGAEMKMEWCPPGSFMMGSPTGEYAWDDNNRQHRVTLTRGFWMGKYPVTQAQWESVMGYSLRELAQGMGAAFLWRREGPNYPMVCVNWEEIMEFCRRAGHGLCLPTEAQWEYACRAGTSGAYAGTGRLDDMGWYEDGFSRMHPVGEKSPNDWGLYDMHGNILEWCADWYQYDLGSAAATDPIAIGPAGATDRVYRGGHFGGPAEHCRSGARGGNKPEYRLHIAGFRVCCPDENAQRPGWKEGAGHPVVHAVPKRPMPPHATGALPTAGSANPEPSKGFWSRWFGG